MNSYKLTIVKTVQKSDEEIKEYDKISKYSDTLPSRRGTMDLYDFNPRTEKIVKVLEVELDQAEFQAVKKAVTETM